MLLATELIKARKKGTNFVQMAQKSCTSKPKYTIYSYCTVLNHFLEQYFSEEVI